MADKAGRYGVPGPTLYVNNLPDRRVTKQVLRRALYNLFIPYGRILSIHVHRTPKQRGQAFVCFSTIPSATDALNDCQGMYMLQKSMRIQYSRSKSFETAIRDGTFDVERKRVLPDGDGKDGKVTPMEGKGDGNDGEDGEGSPPRKKVKEGSGRDEEKDGHFILFVQNLPEEVNADTLAKLFREYPGFKEVRPVPSKPDLAFVEYEHVHQAQLARAALGGFRLPGGKDMKVDYAKK